MSESVELEHDPSAGVSDGVGNVDAVVDRMSGDDSRRFGPAVNLLVMLLP